MSEITETAEMQDFQYFPRLPAELRRQIWEQAAYATRKRVLQVHYDYTDSQWHICQDSISLNPLSTVCKESRALFQHVLGTIFLNEHDIVLLSDPSFVARGPQKHFLDLATANKIACIAITNELWRGLRHTYHDFPTVSRSPGEIVRGLQMVYFYLAIGVEDDLDDEIESQDNDPWTEETSEDWLLGYDFTIDDNEDEAGDEAVNFAIPVDRTGRHTRAMNSWEGETFAPANTGTPADRFLAGLEGIQMEDLQMKGYERLQGLGRLHPAENHPALFDVGPSIEIELLRVLVTEYEAHPEWVMPVISVHCLDEGEMPYNDELLGKPGYDAFDIGSDVGDMTVEEIMRRAFEASVDDDASVGSVLDGCGELAVHQQLADIPHSVSSEGDSEFSDGEE